VRQTKDMIATMNARTDQASQRPGRARRTPTFQHMAVSVICACCTAVVEWELGRSGWRATYLGLERYVADAAHVIEAHDIHNAE
jgi:hypothetical protein